MTHSPTRLAAVLLLAVAPSARAVDLTHAAVLVPPHLSGPERQAVRMLIEEVGKRSWADWKPTDVWPADGTPVILVGPADAVRRLAPGRNVPEGPGPGREGYRIGDRKSTRLNSSHQIISYAVFCLKK